MQNSGTVHRARPVAAPETVRTEADPTSVQRARAAALGVAARVAALVAAADGPAVLLLARPLAVVLAASQTDVGRKPHMPVAECIDAAVHAAQRRAVHGDNHAALVHQLGVALAVLPTLRAHNAGWAVTVVAELAAAAIDVQAARGRDARFRAAAGRLTHDNAIDVDVWPWLGVGASVPNPALPPLRRGHAPVRRGERFVLLTGDCEFRFVPSLARARRPLIASLTAMHHGAARESSSHVSLRRELVPLAPDSRAAKSIVRFRPVCAGRSAITAITEAGVAWQEGKRKQGRRRPIRVAASRVARAAAAAIHACELAHPGEIAADWRKFAAAAAAAAVAAWRHPDCIVVGLATMLAATTEKVAGHTESSPIATVVELAHRCVHAVRNGQVLSTDAVTDIAAGAIDGVLAGHVFNMAADAFTHSAAAALTPDTAGAEAASALGFLWSSYKLGVTPGFAKVFKGRIKLNNKDENVLNDLATAATAAIQATPGRGRRAGEVQRATDAAGPSVSVAVGSLPTLLHRVSATTVLPRGAAPGLAYEAAAHRAACLAAERAVAYMVGTTVEGIRSIVEGGASPRRRAEARRLLGPRARRDGRGGRIAYSYGVDRITRRHDYADISVVMGNCGHAHPLAIHKYEAQGWTARYNTSTRARHTGLQGDPDRRHPYGHVGLGWDAMQGRPFPRGPFPMRCKTCGKRFTLQG